MCPEADQCCLVSEALAAKLADIQLVTLPAHIRLRCIADMAVVRPDHRLGTGAFCVEYLAERLEHVRVA